MIKLLPSDKVKAMKIGDYNHLDYMWAKDVNKHVNDLVIPYLNGIKY